MIDNLLHTAAKICYNMHSGYLDPERSIMNPDSIFLSPAPMPYLTDCRIKRFGANEYHCSRYCEYFVLIFMLGSLLTFTEDSVQTTLRAGEWYIQRKNTWQGASLPSPNAEYYYLHFEAEYTEDMLNRIRLPLRGTFQPNLYLPALKSIDAHFSRMPRNHFEVQSEFYQLLNLLCPQNRTYTSLTASVMDYLNEHYASRITAQTLSALFHYSPEYINRRMKAEIGMTAHACLHMIRMQNAVKLLERTDYPVSEIARECGFADASLFYRSFCQTYGESPSAHRKRYRLPSG